jgi:hypothetical protein
MKPGEGNGKIRVAIARERMYIPEFVDNLFTILMSLHESGVDCGFFQAEGHRVDRNRDAMVKDFLAHPDKPEWLLMLDSDMEHVPNVGQRLAAHKKDIVGALYFHRGKLHDPLAFGQPDFTPDEWGRLTLTWAPIRDEVYDYLRKARVPYRDAALAIDGLSGLIDVSAIGTGAMLIHRGVLETMKPPWFEYITGGNSEDMIFCYNAIEKYGYQVWCDMATISGHYAFVPMGFAQFLMIYEGRGLEHSGFTKEEAADLMAEYYKLPIEAMQKLINDGSAHYFGNYWKESGFKLSDERSVYRDKKSGMPYIIELLWWNSSPSFGEFRKRYIPFRNQRVLEIGAGIGTLALQLAIQRNDVVAVEVNPDLRGFIQLRYSRVAEQIETKLGDLQVIPEINLVEGMFDTAFAIDVLEHLSEEDLKAAIKTVYNHLRPGGLFCYHNNFGQQEIYPMHHDYSVIFDKWMCDAGFYVISETEARKP